MTVTVVKRDGSRQAVSFDQVLYRVEEHRAGLAVDPVLVAQSVIQGIKDGITTKELDDFTVQTAASLSSVHPDYSFLAARVAVSDLHKRTSPSVECVADHLSDEALRFLRANAEAIDSALRFERDYSYDIFGFKTLERSYLLRDERGEVIERPQVMLMRVAIGIHCGEVDRCLETYEEMSLGRFTHATPTMFNAGTRSPHLASCFLLSVMDDSIEGIFETLKRCALISKGAGGIGLSFSNVRASGSLIRSTGGRSSGLLPFLRVFDATARAVDQGGGKRKGAFAVYLEPWHLDVFVFLNMKKHHGAEELRARDLFYAMWLNDLFMRRVEEDEEWTLLCPSECADLTDLYGPAFDARYEQYEREKRGSAGVGARTVKARDLWNAILDSQIETGTPYMLYKDACNLKSNQQNLGTVRCSNLCTEIVEYTSADEVAVCNLASVALPRFVRGGKFDFDDLSRVVRMVVRNLNRVIDVNAYPVPEARASNLKHRPIGVGVQGLADVFFELGIAFDSPEARVLNREIFEAIYYSCLDESCDLARRLGPYASYEGSPASKGKLQFDLWEEQGHVVVADLLASSRWDWTSLRGRIAKDGLRNSLLVAPMPTASTAQILGNTECFEPITSNVYVRRVLSGEFTVMNRHLVKTLQGLGLWNEETRTKIVAANGSVASLSFIPPEVRKVYKTAWEIAQRSIIDMAAERAVFIDQSQSLNLFMAETSHAKLSSMHFYAWKKGLKTGMYYLRSKPARNAVQVTVPVAKGEGGGGCESCSA